MKKLLIITALTVHANAAIAEGIPSEMNIAPDVIVSSATENTIDQTFVAPMMGLIMLCVFICGSSSPAIQALTAQ